MIEPFLITNNLMGYVDGSIPCPSKTLSVTDGAIVPKENPNYPIWVSNDAHVRMLIISTISEAYFRHVQVSGLREEYNGLKTTITAHQSPTAFRELHALLSDHDYMLGKTRAPAASITSSFAANYVVGSPSMPEARQAQLSELTAQLSALGFQVCGIGHIPSQCLNRDPSTIRTQPFANFANTRAQSSNASANWHSGANSHVTPDLEAMDNLKAYYGDDALHVGNGIDFHETFSPVVKLTTIQAVLSLAVTNDWPLRQLDIQNAFFHGNLKEQVYMKQPPGFIDPQRPNHVCLLYKSLYGLKQAPRAWFERLSKALFDLGFKGSKTDPSLFIYSRGLVYVDDIIVTGNNKGTIDNIICQLGSAFALKDLGPLNYFLGIEIVPHVSGILPSQKKYILELLQSVGLSNCNLVSSPMVCQYMHAPTENHWSAVKRILRYLHGTVEHGMLIRRSSGSTLQALTDVLWKGNPDTSLEAFSARARDSDDRRSTGGFAIYLGSNLISWTARKQRTVSRSSTEAEYKALADTVTKLTRLQALLNELGIRSSSTPILWCDNLGATYLSANPIFHARTKHVEIDYHFVREKVAQRDLRVQHISKHDQIADIFTKPLPTPRFFFLRSKLHVVARP
ncbi:putative RNA-directed DNA polymerase [Tanacetum coccineum]